MPNDKKNYKIILKRYDDYNSTKIVGFDVVITNTRKSRYFEHIFSLSECDGKSVNEVCHMTFLMLKSQIEDYASVEDRKEDIPIGGEFIPPLDE